MIYGKIQIKTIAAVGQWQSYLFLFTPVAGHSTRNEVRDIEMRLDFSSITDQIE